MKNSLFNVRAYADNPNWEKMVRQVYRCRLLEDHKDHQIHTNGG